MSLIQHLPGPLDAQREMERKEKNEARDSTPLPPAEQLIAAGQNTGRVLSVEM